MLPCYIGNVIYEPESVRELDVETSLLKSGCPCRHCHSSFRNDLQVRATPAQRFAEGETERERERETVSTLNHALKFLSSVYAKALARKCMLLHSV